LNRCLKISWVVLTAAQSGSTFAVARDAPRVLQSRKRSAKMTVTLELRPEEVAVLDARARAMGVDMVAVLHDLIAQIAATERPLYETATLDEWDRALDKLSDDVDPTIPPIPDEALRRDSLYGDRVG
jgi:hypothetical protein